MRVLAVDLGNKRIGTAVSDSLGISVRPVETIHRSGLKNDIERLKFLTEELEVEAVVVGLPFRMDSSVGDAASRVLKFTEVLRKEITVPVYTQDERLTSYEADRLLIERGANRKERSKRSDEFAAALILQDFLSQMKPKN